MSRRSARPDRNVDVVCAHRVGPIHRNFSKVCELKPHPSHGSNFIADFSLLQDVLPTYSARARAVVRGQEGLPQGATALARLAIWVPNIKHAIDSLGSVGASVWQWTYHCIRIPCMHFYAVRRRWTPEVISPTMAAMVSIR